jgi:hypothetical protein
LSDANIPEDKEGLTRDFRDKISDELDSRKIPYIFVTKARIKGSHDFDVNIIEREKGRYKLFKRFDTFEKNESIWEEAYQRLKSKIIID